MTLTEAMVSTGPSNPTPPTGRTSVAAVRGLERRRRRASSSCSIAAIARATPSASLARHDLVELDGHHLPRHARTCRSSQPHWLGSPPSADQRRPSSGRPPPGPGSRGRTRTPSSSLSVRAAVEERRRACRRWSSSTMNAAPSARPASPAAPCTTESIVVFGMHDDVEARGLLGLVVEPEVRTDDAHERSPSATGHGRAPDSPRAPVACACLRLRAAVRRCRRRCSTASRASSDPRHPGWATPRTRPRARRGRRRRRRGSCRSPGRSTRETPTSMTTAPGLTMSAVMMPGHAGRRDDDVRVPRVLREVVGARVA